MRSCDLEATMNEHLDYWQRLLQSRRDVAARTATTPLTEARLIATRLQPIADAHRRRQRAELTMRRWLELTDAEKADLFDPDQIRLIDEAAKEHRRARF
jgi:hypothetical protein